MHNRTSKIEIKFKFSFVLSVTLVAHKQSCLLSSALSEKDLKRFISVENNHFLRFTECMTILILVQMDWFWPWSIKMQGRFLQSCAHAHQRDAWETKQFKLCKSSLKKKIEGLDWADASITYRWSLQLSTTVLRNYLRRLYRIMLYF